MEKKTYGAPRYMDWVAQIRAGAATVRVHFTGGALTVYGVTPAEYTTTDPFTQKVIEQSQYFKEGRIVLLKKVEMSDPQCIKPKKAPKRGAEPAAPVQTPALETPATPAPVQVESVAPGNESTQTAEEVTEIAEAIQESVDLTNVEASCLQDAQAYLQEHFNISSYKVRSYEAAQRAAAEHGVQFTGAKFGPAKDEGNVAEEVAVDE